MSFKRQLYVAGLCGAATGQEQKEDEPHDEHHPAKQWRGGAGGDWFPL